MIIVAGFEPFGGRSHNRSWQAVDKMQVREGVERVCLPVDYAQLEQRVPALVARTPVALLLVGEARRTQVTLERTARNACNASRLDNTGSPRDLVQFGGPEVLEATWDVARALAAAAGHVAVAESDDAGGFCCNAALYHALHHAKRQRAAIRIGFVHVPRDDDPPTDQLAAALAAIVETMR